MTFVILRSRKRRVKISHRLTTNGDLLVVESVPRHGYPKFRLIAVGTAVAGGPPHRSVREPFVHTAPALSKTLCRGSGLADSVLNEPDKPVTANRLTVFDVGA